MSQLNLKLDFQQESKSPIIHDTGWKTSYQSSCYLKQSRTVVFRNKVPGETVMKFALDEMAKLEGQVKSYTIDQHIVYFYHAVDSGD